MHATSPGQGSPGPDRRPATDAGGIVLGWLVKLCVVLGAFGIVAFDGIAVATARMSVEDDAGVVAREASSELRRTGDVQRAYVAALTSALETNPDNVVPPEWFVADRDGTVTVQVRRTADTIVLSRIGWLADWAEVQGSATVLEIS